MAFTKIVGAGIHTLSNITSHNIHSSGIITATTFDGPFDGSTGDFSGNVTIGGNLIVNGDTTTLNTTLREVELLRVDATNNTVAAGIITQRGSGDILNLYDGSTEVFSVADGGGLTLSSTIDVTGQSTFRDRLQLIDTAPEILLSKPSGGLDSRILNDGSGNLIIGHGINSDTPTERLRIESSGAMRLKSEYLRFQAGDHQVSDFSQKVGLKWTYETDIEIAKIEVSRPSWSGGPSDMLFHTCNTSGTVSEALRITSDGKIGINESANINGRLHVQHDALGENILYATRYNDQGNDKPILAVT